jgi:hypothetical protein
MTAASRDPGFESGDPRDELEPSLRERVLRLDEPVAWGDWNDVVRRSRVACAGRLRSLRTLGGFAAAAVVAAGLTALIVGLRPSLVGIGGGTAAAPNDFAQFDLGAPPNLPRNAIAWQSRVITSVRLRDGPHTLYVAPTAQGGFCYEWAGDGTGGCARLARGPLAADWDTGRVVGVVSSLVVSSVRITFSDGTSVAPPIAWIKAPINAGFFLYDIPRGKIVAEVSGDDDGRTLSQVTWYSL